MGRSVLAGLVVFLLAMALPSPASAYGQSASPSHSYDYDSPIATSDDARNLTQRLRRGIDLADETARSFDGVSGAFVASSGEQSAPNTIRAGASSVDEALAGLRAGRISGVRVVGSVDQLDDVFAGLSKGGTQIESSYGGKVVQLPDGTTVGLRGASKSGGPTIDARLPGGRTVKVHVDPWPPTQ